MAADKGLSPSIRERAQRNHSAMLRALSNTGQAVAADLIGCDPSTVTRIKDDQLERFAALLAACKLKVVHEDLQLIKRDTLVALRTFARDGVEHAGEEPSVMGDNL